MADRLNVQVIFKTTDAADGSEFYTATNEWSGVPYADYIQFQALMLGVLQQMQGWGELRAKGKGGGHVKK